MTITPHPDCEERRFAQRSRFLYMDGSELSKQRPSVMDCKAKEKPALGADYVGVDEDGELYLLSTFPFEESHIVGDKQFWTLLPDHMHKDLKYTNLQVAAMLKGRKNESSEYTWKSRKKTMKAFLPKMHEEVWAKFLKKEDAKPKKRSRSQKGSGRSGKKRQKKLQPPPLELPKVFAQKLHPGAFRELNTILFPHVRSDVGVLGLYRTVVPLLEDLWIKSGFGCLVQVNGDIVSDEAVVEVVLEVMSAVMLISGFNPDKPGNCMEWLKTHFKPVTHAPIRSFIMRKPLITNDLELEAMLMMAMTRVVDGRTVESHHHCLAALLGLVVGVCCYTFQRDEA